MVSGSVLAGTYITGIDASQSGILVHTHGVPEYQVKRLNGGMRYEVIFNKTALTNQQQYAQKTALISNLLATTGHGNANLYLLLPKQGKLSMSPVVGGFSIKVEEASSSAEVPAVHSVHTLQTSVTVPSHHVHRERISGIRFKRLHKGGGLLNLSIAGKEPLIHVSKTKRDLTLTIPDFSVSKNLSHIYNTNQFGSIVKSAEVFQLGSSTVIRMRANNSFIYSVYQFNSKIKVYMKHRSSKKTVTEEKRLSMDFQNIGVRSVINLIANFTGKNIIVANNVSGVLSIHLKDVPWREAFNVILQTQGLAVKHIGTVLWVAPAADVASQEEAELKASASKRKLEPLITDLIQLKYASASSVASLLKGMKKDVGGMPMSSSGAASLAGALGVPRSSLLGNSLLGKRGSVSVVTRQNALLVRDTPSAIRNIRQLIVKIDKPVKQVLIQARIVQITTAAAQSLGVQWGGTYTGNGAGGVVNLSGTGASGASQTQGGSYPISGGAGGSTGFTVPSLVNLSPSTAGSALASINPASLGFALGTTAGNRILDLQLQALQADNNAKIISKPSVMTQDNAKAVIEQGQEIPYQSSTSSGATAVSYKKAVLSLSVTPHIAPNNKVTMGIVATNNQPNYANAVPTGIPINTEEVKTKLLVSNGQTIVIGGIYTDTVTTTESGIPVLKDIPLLGWLFKDHLHNNQKTELLIFIRPKIIG
jgi:type IV pilus assembly protein PilQ